jgi:hypothetical protein
MNNLYEFRCAPKTGFAMIRNCRMGFPQMPNIFLLGSSGLVEMSQQPYESEDLLQALIAQYPSVLAGDQFAAEEPRRWLLVTREAGVPDGPGATDRWALDHLFLDQDGVPTFVEVKRGSDTRLPAACTDNAEVAERPDGPCVTVKITCAL